MSLHQIVAEIGAPVISVVTGEYGKYDFIRITFENLYTASIFEYKEPKRFVYEVGILDADNKLTNDNLYGRTIINDVTYPEVIEIAKKIAGLPENVLKKA